LKVSVIVPVYNSCEYIRSCFTQLKKQIFTDFEVIFVVDVRSTDGSLSLLEKLISNESNFKIYLQTDNGRAGGARNIGIDVSNGDYLWFLDVDDCFSPLFLKDMTSIIDS